MAEVGTRPSASGEQFEVFGKEGVRDWKLAGPFKDQATAEQFIRHRRSILNRQLLTLIEGR